MPAIAETSNEQKLALDRALQRGRTVVAAILASDEMLSTRAMSLRLQVTPARARAWRRAGTLLGLRGEDGRYRYPNWQLDDTGAPFPELADLSRILEEPWSIYRFLLTSHPVLDGSTAREQLRRGRGAKVLEAARSVAEGDFT